MKNDQNPSVERQPLHESAVADVAAGDRRPSKDEVRAWLARVIASRRPPPAMDDIKRALWRSKDNDEERGGS